ncbi:MAG: porin family protein [Methylomicrobium sp.]
MSKKIHTPCAIAAAALTLAGVVAAPEAMARSSKAERIAEAASNKADALEAQLQAVQAELSSLRAAVNAPRDDAKVQELDQWMQQVKSAPVKVETKDNMVFFRGGFARNDNRRNDLLTGGQFGGNVIDNVLGGGATNRDGWYIGAGFDFSVNDDLFGLMDDTEVLAELMFEWKSFGSKHFNNHPAIVQGAGDAVGDPSVNPNGQNGPLCTLINYASNDELGGGATGAGTANCDSVSVSQFTLAAAPKIKFMKGSNFRPWIEPIGLALHVFSPPSNGVTVFNPGIMFGAGADYKIWKDIYIGADARYHLTGGDSDGVKLDGLTAGGYLGLGF